MNYIYITLSGLGLLAFVIATLLKGEKIKQNLFYVFTGSIVIGISYMFTPMGINGAVSSFIGGSQAIINYFFARKDKKIPVWITGIYVLIFAGMNIAVINSYIGILALLASLCFAGSVAAKNGKEYRIWQIINSSLWISYDLLSKSYGPMVTHLVLFCFTVVGMLVNDFNKKES